MKEELSSIERIRTWELVELPHQKRPIAVKWVYKFKMKHDSTVAKHKAMLVANG